LSIGPRQAANRPQGRRSRLRDGPRALVERDSVIDPRAAGSLWWRPSPVDRARTGSKHHLHVDAGGVPLAVSLTGVAVEPAYHRSAPWGLLSDVRQCHGRDHDVGGAMTETIPPKA
jgi:hypothetical protein